MIRKLPAWQIFVKTLFLLWEKRDFVIKIGWPLILFSGLIGICIDSGVMSSPEPVRPVDPLAAGYIDVGEGWESFAVSVVMVLLTSFAAIFWHRNILLDEQHVPAFPVRFDAIFWRFMGYSLLLVILLLCAFGLLLALLVALPVFVTGLDTAILGEEWPAFLPLLLFLMFIAARAGLAFPAAAIGNRGFGINASWRATRGNSWRILLLQALSITLTALIGFSWIVASEAISNIAGNLPYTVSYLANGVYQLFFVLLGVGLLSLTYAWLVEEKELTGA